MHYSGISSLRSWSAILRLLLMLVMAVKNKANAAGKLDVSSGLVYKILLSCDEQSLIEKERSYKER